MPVLQQQGTRAAGRRAWLLPYVVLAVALVVAVAAALAFRAAVRERDQRRFDNAMQATSDRIGNRIDTYVALLLASRALFAARGDDVGVEHFRAFVDALELQRRYPGVQGVGFTRAFPTGDRVAAEAELRRAGFADARVWPDEPRSELHAIVMLEPLDRRNRAALGYDMFTEEVRRDAMSRARDSGHPAASGPVTLVQEIDSDKQPGFLIYVPVYRGGRVPATVDERRAALLGFIYSAFRMEDLLLGIFGSEREPRAAFTVRDRAAPASILYQSAARSGSPSFATSSTIDVAGRAWTLDFWTLPAFDRYSSRWMWPYVLALGAVACLVLFGLTRRQVRAAEQLRVHARMLESLRAEAEAASRTKDDFLAMLGHELRNPLAPIVTALELLDHRLSGAHDRERAIIARQVAHLQRLVDDLLDVAAITRGKVKLTRAPVEVTRIVSQAVELVRPLLDERRHTLRVDVPAGLWLDADLARLVQVVSNLLTNAGKYTPPGGKLEVSAARDGADVVLRVSDDGDGIPPGTLERLFQLFEQGEQAVDRAQGGLGLGLAIVSSLVQLHGGTIEGHSEGRGRGSTFTVRLPARPEADAEADQAASQAEATPAVAPAAAPATTRARRVLVVDDNADAADMLAELLTMAGHDATVAYHGEQALELAVRQTFDVAVLDIGLPGIDGHELARRLRALRPVTLVAVTGYGQDRDREQARQAGFDHHLVKPVDSADVLALVAAAPARATA